MHWQRDQESPTPPVGNDRGEPVMSEGEGWRMQRMALRQTERHEAMPSGRTRERLVCTELPVTPEMLLNDVSPMRMALT